MLHLQTSNQSPRNVPLRNVASCIRCHAYTFPHPPRGLLTTQIACPIWGGLKPPGRSEPRQKSRARTRGADCLYPRESEKGFSRKLGFRLEAFSETELPAYGVLGN